MKQTQKYNFRDYALRQSIPAETLFIISEAEKCYKSKDYPYRYMDGKEMSTRDILRLEVMNLHEMDKPLGLTSATTRLRNVIHAGYAKILPRSYSGKPIRFYVGLTIKGKTYLKDHMDTLKELYGDKLNIIGFKSEEDKERLMPKKDQLVVT